MNIKEYISTGILETYAMGELTETERQEVENLLALHPELREELRLIEETTEQLLMKTALTPKSRVKEKVLAAVRESEPKVIPLALETGVHLWRYATAASVVLALTSAFMAYNFWDKWQHAQLSLNELLAQNQQIAQDYNVVNQRLDQIETELRIIDNPSFRKVVMKGTANAPEALASVYWNEATQEVFLSVQHLKELSQDQQYQLWAIVDGKPVDMGVFDLSAGGLLKMKTVAKAAAFAVTIEPRGGKPGPTLETMQVLGNS